MLCTSFLFYGNVLEDTMATDIDNNLFEAIGRVCCRAKELESTTRVWQEKTRLFDLVRYLEEWKQGYQEQQTTDKDEPDDPYPYYPPDEGFRLDQADVAPEKWISDEAFRYDWKVR